MSDKPFETGQYLSLKEYIGITISPLERELSQMRSAIEKLAGSELKLHELENLKLQVASLSEGLQELEKRLDILEQHDNVSTWLFRFVAGVGTALLIAWLGGFIR